MKDMVVHIGMSKTGTTTLQRAVFEKHSQVCYLGKIYKSPHSWGCGSEDIYDFLSPLLWPANHPLDVASAKKFFNETLLSEAGADRQIVGSWEGLSQQGIDIFKTSVERLQAVCGSCRIMITVRNPVARLPSMYLQHLRGNHAQLENSFISFEEWLGSEAQRRGGLDQVFGYRDYIEIAINQFGKDNVGVFVYEHFQADANQYLQEVSGFLGIDPAETIALADGQRLHSRLSASQLARMEELNSSLLGRLRWWLASGQKRKELVGFSDPNQAHSSDSAGAAAQVELSPEVIERIENAARSGNRWLVEHLGLELEAYGYPL